MGSYLLGSLDIVKVYWVLETEWRWASFGWVSGNWEARLSKISGEQGKNNEYHNINKIQNQGE
jgi:hypothetical protein